MKPWFQSISAWAEKSAPTGSCMGKGNVILVLFGLWVAIAGTSFLDFYGIDEPANQNRTFERLGVFVGWQIAAFLLALITAGTAAYATNAAKWKRLVGTLPFCITILALIVQP
ncbi:MAG: hypothetical protein AAF439_11275 [Pseudomonadota bacterium]